MKRLLRLNKKLAIAGITVGLIVGATGVAVAYYTSNGHGTGAAVAGSVNGVTIAQIGPAYDSLIPNNNYIQDQTYGGAGVTDFGNQVNLASTGQLENVVVAFHNWGSAISALPVTFSIFSPGATTGSVGSPIISNTTNLTMPAANVNGSPTEANLTFDFSSDFVQLPSTVVYGITFNDGSLNVALSSSGNNLSVGSDSYPGYVFVSLISNVWVPGWQVDVGSCSTPTSVFAAVYVWCGANSNPGNLGAYDNAQGADIPAVEFNVIGGSTPPLYPGGPAEPVNFIVTNSSSGSVTVNQVDTAVSTISNAGTNNAYGPCTTSMFSVTPVNIDSSLGSNDSLTGTAMITMINDGNNQNNCQGATLGLTFSST